MGKFIHKIKTDKKFFAIVISLLIALIVICIACVAFLLSDVLSEDKQDKVIFYSDFNEDVGDFKSSAWNKANSVFGHSVSDGIDGSGCVKVSNIRANDARYEINLDVEKNTYYKISGWVKTENITDDGIAAGANISVMKNFEKYQYIYGTNDWTYIETYGKTDRNQEEITVALRVGFYSGDNTGTAWFDNIEVKRISSLPDGVVAVNFADTLTANNVQNDEDEPLDENDYFDFTKALVIITVVVFLSFLIAYRYARAYDGFGRKTPLIPPQGKHISLAKGMMFIFMLGILIRLVLAFSPIQCSVDVNVFKYWGDMSVSGGFANTYNTLSGSIDYPPLYVYVLYAASSIKSLFGFLGEYQDIFYSFLIKLTPIIADCIIGLFVYKICDKKMKTEWVLFAVATWILNPVVIVDSACWGQVDSVLALFVLFGVYFAVNKKHWQSGLMLGFGLMLKPQAIIVYPIIFFILFKDFIKSKESVLKRFIPSLKTLGGWLIGAVTPCIPFMFKMGLTEIELLGKTVNVPWIFSLFLGTANHYAYATVNALNSWFIMGKNWILDSEGIGFWSIIPFAIIALAFSAGSIVAAPMSIFGFAAFAILFSVAGAAFTASTSMFIWGMIAIVAICVFIWIVYMIDKNQPFMPYLLAAALYMGVSMFSSRMHERYFFTAIIFLLVAFIMSNNKITMWLYAAMSAFGFLTICEVLLDLEVGRAVKETYGDAGYSVYSKYLWVSETPYRMVIAWAMVIISIALFIAAILFICCRKQFKHQRFAVWKLEDGELDDSSELADAPLLSLDYETEEFTLSSSNEVMDNIMKLADKESDENE